MKHSEIESTKGVPLRAYSPVSLREEEVRQIRQALHELANVFTGILISGGLLKNSLAGDLRQRYGAELCLAGERGASLVRKAREVFVAHDEAKVNF